MRGIASTFGVIPLKIKARSASGAELTKAQRDEAHLMSRLAQGDKRAAAHFVDIYLPYVKKICAKYLGNHSGEIEDAAQDVFASVWRNAKTWEAGRAKLTTWLYRIAANRSIDILRRRQGGHHSSIDEAYDIADNSQDVLNAQLQNDQQKIIKAALDGLSTPQRRAIELVYFHEMKQADAAHRLNVSVSALESTLRRARAQLHKKLASQSTQLLSLWEGR